MSRVYGASLHESIPLLICKHLAESGGDYIRIGNEEDGCCDFLCIECAKGMLREPPEFPDAVSMVVFCHHCIEHHVFPRLGFDRTDDPTL